MSNVTHILERVQQGDPAAANELLPLVYRELRQLASNRMAREAPGQTLQPTALVHEAWMRIVGEENPKFDGRSHFFACLQRRPAAGPPSNHAMTGIQRKGFGSG